MPPSTAYEATGRTRQKARTRRALVAATRELLGEGVTPTVEQVADRAGISRTTAYRYFPNRRELVAATYPQLEATTLLGADAPREPVARLDAALDALAKQLVEHEPELRAALRLSLESPAAQSPVRQGRAVRWFEDALAPLAGRMSRAELRRLAVAIRAAFGIEPLVWLTDVAGLSRREALAVMRRTAHALLRAELERVGT